MKQLLIAFVALVVLVGTGEARAETRVCTMQYEPVCGARQVECVRAPCYPVYETFGNSCVLAAEGATFIHAGECTASETGPVRPEREAYVPPAHCSAWFDGCNHCSRQPNGMAACTLRACVDEPAQGYCTKYDAPPVPVTPPSMPEPASATSSPELPPDSASFLQTVLSWLENLLSRFF